MKDFHVLMENNVGSVQHYCAFKGKVIAHVSGESVCRMISKATGSVKKCWMELILYHANTGEYVCQRICRTVQESERDAYEGKVCSDHSEVIGFFGDNWLARELFEEAGINISELLPAAVAN